MIRRKNKPLAYRGSFPVNVSRHTPIKKKRSKPRRGRVEDSDRIAWADLQPCCVTGTWPATTHHVRSYGSPKDDTKIMRLADYLHMDTNARPGIPCIEHGKQLFEKFHGISIDAEVLKLQEQYEREKATL